MKRALSTVLAAAAATVAVCGIVTPAYADGHADCSAAKPASVYTDGLNTFAGLCVSGAYVEVGELKQLTTGTIPLSAVTGVAPVDETTSAVKRGYNVSSLQCTAQYGDAIVIYTDALNHVVGACDPFGNYLQVNEVAGALVKRNNLVSMQTQFFTATVQTQATDGGPGVLIHPKVVITPRP